MPDHASPANLGDEVALLPGGEALRACYACGSCVSRCMIPRRDPAYNPRRLFHMAILDMRDAVFEDPTTWHCTACDLCYDACPQEIRISDVLGAVRRLALEAGYTSPLETVVVDPALCSGCGTCVEICPYEALSVELEGIEQISRVDHDHCMGCGDCVTACPNGAIGGGSFADASLLEQLAEAFAAQGAEEDP